MSRSHRYIALCIALPAVVLAILLAVPTHASVPAPPPSSDPAIIGAAVPNVDVNAPAAPGQFVIKFKPGTAGAARSQAVQAEGGHFVDRIAALDVDAAAFPALTGHANPAAAAALIARLQRNPNVVYVEPNYLYRADFSPNDPGLGQQWAWSKIQAPTAWNTTQGTTAVVIAGVDTGIQRNHPDLDAKIVAGYDYVDNDTAPDDGNGHGTHTAGTMAAETNNATGGAGMCPNCKLMPVRVLDNSGSGTLTNVANGITYAADHGAKVINLSLGGSGSATLQNAVDYAWNKNVFLACAAGNDNTSSTASAYPAAYANCFAVASTNSSDVRSSFSNYGTWVKVAAPGENIYSTWINSGYNTISGTSMATPHAAGLAGLLSSQGLTNAQIRDRICNTADQISGTGSSWSCGRINAYRAVTATSTAPSPTATRTTVPSPTAANTPAPSPTLAKTSAPSPTSTSAPVPSPTAISTPTPTSGTLDAEESAFLNLINNYRQTNGLAPLKLNTTLTTASKWMSQDMASKNYFSHTDSLGRDPFQRMAAFGYTANTSKGENIAAGYQTATAVFDAWKASAGHNANMLSSSYTVIGIGRAYDARSTYGWYWTTDFGGM